MGQLDPGVSSYISHWLYREPPGKELWYRCFCDRFSKIGEMNLALNLRAWCLLGLSSWCSHLRRARGYWVGRNLVHKEGFAPWQQKIRKVRSKTVFNRLHSTFMYTGNCWSQQRCVKIAWGSDFPNVTHEGWSKKCSGRDIKDLGPLVWQRGQKGEVVELAARVNLQNQGIILMGGSETNLVWSWWTFRGCVAVKEMVFVTGTRKEPKENVVLAWWYFEFQAGPFRRGRKAENHKNM